MTGGQLELLEVPPLAPPAKPRKPPVHGYAARPGTGPKGQRCNTCVSMQRVLQAGARSYKCEIRAAEWRPGPETDVKHNAPACSYWERKPYAKEPPKS